MEPWIELTWLIWLAVALVLGVIEVLTLAFVCAMPAVGAVAAAIAAGSGASLVWQVGVFAVVSLVLLAFVRPILVRLRGSPGSTLRTNVAALPGRVAVVLEAVTDRTGLVRIGGDVWTARTEWPGETLAVDDAARVVRIDGATAVVAPPVAGPTRDGATSDTEEVA